MTCTAAACLPSCVSIWVLKVRSVALASCVLVSDLHIGGMILLLISLFSWMWILLMNLYMVVMIFIWHGYAFISVMWWRNYVKRKQGKQISPFSSEQQKSSRVTTDTSRIYRLLSIKQYLCAIHGYHHSYTSDSTTCSKFTPPSYECIVHIPHLSYVKSWVWSFGFCGLIFSDEFKLISSQLVSFWF